MTVGRSWRRDGRFFARRDAKITRYRRQGREFGVGDRGFREIEEGERARCERSSRKTTPPDLVEAGAWPVRLRSAADDDDGAGQDRAHGNHDQGDGPVEEAAKCGKLSLRHDAIPFLV